MVAALCCKRRENETVWLDSRGSDACVARMGHQKNHRTTTQRSAGFLASGQENRRRHGRRAQAGRVDRRAHPLRDEQPGLVRFRLLVNGADLRAGGAQRRPAASGCRPSRHSRPRCRRAKGDPRQGRRLHNKDLRPTAAFDRNQNHRTFSRQRRGHCPRVGDALRRFVRRSEPGGGRPLHPLHQFDRSAGRYPEWRRKGVHGKG